MPADTLPALAPGLTRDRNGLKPNTTIVVLKTQTRPSGTWQLVTKDRILYTFTQGEAPSARSMFAEPQITGQARFGPDYRLTASASLPLARLLINAARHYQQWLATMGIDACVCADMPADEVTAKDIRDLGRGEMDRWVLLVTAAGRVVWRSNNYNLSHFAPGDVLHDHATVVMSEWYICANATDADWNDNGLADAAAERFLAQTLASIEACQSAAAAAAAAREPEWERDILR